MDKGERATVMLLHGSSEDRLRQAIAQGLVKAEVQQDIEDVLAKAEEARVYAEAMQREVAKKKTLISALEDDIKRMEEQRRSDEAYYQKASDAYRREERRKKDNADRKETFVIAALGAGAFIVANILGRLIFGILIK